MSKREQEIMEILEAFDLTRNFWSAAQLSGCDPKTVQRYVGKRDRGEDFLAPAVRSKLIDDFADKVEELVDRSKGKVRADVVHDKLVAMGYEVTERTDQKGPGRGHPAPVPLAPTQSPRQAALLYSWSKPPRRSRLSTGPVSARTSWVGSQGRLCPSPWRGRA